MQELTDERLHKEILRLEYEKPRLVQWTQYDEDRLLAYRELEQLRRKVIAQANRIEDDSKTVNRLCAMNGFPVLTEKAQ